MIPRKFIRSIVKCALCLLLMVALTSLAQSLMADPPARPKVEPRQAPLAVMTCPATVLPNNGGTSVNARAPSTRYAFSRAVYLITAAELAANGYASGNMPMSVGWNYFAQSGPAGSAPLKIYLENTSDTTNTKSTTFATAVSTMTLVHNATTSLPGVAGPFDVTLSGGSPFTYTGGGLYVAYDWGQYTGTLSTTANVSCNTNLANGLLGANSAAATLTASAFRPETRMSSATQNDAAINGIYSLGQIPLGVAQPQNIQALVANKGAMAQTNLPVTVSISGAETFSGTQMVASLAACTGLTTVALPPWTATVLGNDTVTASVPPDDIATNNSLMRPLNVTPLNYSYKYPGSTATGGVGFTGATGALLAKFPITGANAVTAVTIEFPNATATTYRVAIYGDSGSGVPSTTPLYVDASDRTVTGTGPVTITLPSPVMVPAGNFYAGIHQTNTTNAGLGFDVESPIRANAFYEASPLPPTAWFDFSPGGDFKLNVGVIMQNAAPTATSVVSRKVHGAAGTFDISLPGSVECRSGGASNDYQVVFTFPTAVTFSGASVATGTGSVSGSSGSGTNTVTVNLTGVTNAQYITVTLASVNDGTSTANVSVRMGVLVGDTNGNGSVSSADVSQTKAVSGQVVGAGNFRSDVNASGTLTSADISLVKASSGSSLP